MYNVLCMYIVMINTVWSFSSHSAFSDELSLVLKLVFLTFLVNM